MWIINDLDSIGDYGSNDNKNDNYNTKGLCNVSHKRDRYCKEVGLEKNGGTIKDK